MSNILSYSTKAFRELGLTDKEIFTPEEFEKLYPKYLIAKDIRDKEMQLHHLRVSLQAAECPICPLPTNNRVAEIEAEIADIGELPEEAPESLYERYGWIELRRRLKELEKQLRELAYIPEVAPDPVDTEAIEAQIAVLEAEVAQLRQQLGGVI